ncbi:unnamed protein product [Staurois parvus]|uniref:Uncharacterized protein n=1 Tax=Staurois parvus TaxID=386267 RepID=A0ABN9HIR6_9NEOB|nr:unnamed protein product [Staurois parvus]
METQLIIIYIYQMTGKLYPGQIETRIIQKHQRDFRVILRC